VKHNDFKAPQQCSLLGNWRTPDSVAICTEVNTLTRELRGFYLMSPIVTYTLLLALLLYLLLLLSELIKDRNWKSFFLQVSAIVGVVALLNLLTGFPRTTLQAFGGVSPIIAITIMFVFTILGTVARYFFYLRGKFSWRSFLKPVFISPIVLLPLLGTVQGVRSFEPVQMVSFAILAFQNGFFWKVILENAKKQV